MSPNMHVHLRLNGPFLFTDFIKIDCDGKIFVKMVSMKFNENISCFLRIHGRTDGQTYDDVEIHC